VQAGVTPDWPRPAPPSLLASRVVAVVAVALALALTLATGCAPADADAADAETLRVACGTLHSCDLSRDGRVRCWGDGARGQLGLGAFEGALTPQRVPGLEGVIDLAAGGDTTCAVTREGALFCWGYDDHGQAGDGGFAARATPHRVPGLPPVRRVSLGYAHACALDAGGAVYCWGFNGTGAILKDGPRSIATPTRVFAAVRAVDLVAGAVSTCAVDGDGVARCQGDASALPPGEVTEVRAVVLAAGWSCFARADALRCFGLVPGGTDARFPDEGASYGALRAYDTSGGGYDHACARDAVGTLWCWGKNDHGQLSGPMARGPLPVPVALPAPVSAVAVGFAHSCAVAGGRTHCWGEGTDGQLGTGEAIASLDPAEIPR
jgi:alpha-tubulin suppressor-like RCC1 family protein